MFKAIAMWAKSFMKCPPYWWHCGHGILVQAEPYMAPGCNHAKEGALYTLKTCCRCGTQWKVGI